ncbi:MAG: hypothetical protein E7525_03045 [Ruminococcaceae bacterium]|nr:hypothetical protein [Oscillospiraceae bacterium]
MKKGIIAITSGVLLPLLWVIPYVYTMTKVMSNNAPTVGIIGGADAPTSRFLAEMFLQKHFYSMCLTAMIGLVLIVLGVVWIVKAKKSK